MEEAAEEEAAITFPPGAFPMAEAATEGKEERGYQNETAVFGTFLL